jgi:large subunit ribosomal protein L6
MSRIGRQPVKVVDGVKLSIDGRMIHVEGPQGKLSWEHHPDVAVTYDAVQKLVTVTRANDERLSRALHGLTRALIQNMIVGAKQGYEKRLEVQGVGYVVTIQGKVISLRVGYANEVKLQIPVGLKVTCPDQTHIVVQGCDKQLVGQFAAMLRSAREPEPYKGKGVRYQGEHVKIKPGKAAQ